MATTTRAPAPLSLSEAHGSVAIPAASAGVFAQYRAFAGPALLVGVGYIDPGNWGTDLQADAQYRYGLLWVVALASAMAIVLQIVSARLGVVARQDLAQACRARYPRWTLIPNWLSAEIAIAGCDLAEAERRHVVAADRIETERLPEAARAEEDADRQRRFVLQVVQPGLVGLMDGSVSTMASVFAAAFATRERTTPS